MNARIVASSLQAVSVQNVRCASARRDGRSGRRALAGCSPLPQAETQAASAPSAPGRASVVDRELGARERVPDRIDDGGDGEGLLDVHARQRGRDLLG